MDERTDDEARTYVCVTCGGIFLSHDDLDDHRKREHDVDAGETTAPAQQAVDGVTGE